jgi:hypothetical protein
MTHGKNSSLVDPTHEAIAQRQAEVLIDYLTDPETVQRITTAWSGSLDAMIGRGVRRIAIYALGSLFLVGVVKFGVLAEFFKKMLG